MNLTGIQRLLLGLVVLIVSGCTTVLKITEPADEWFQDCLPRFAVNFGPTFTGNFRADIDGLDWTAPFTPAPAPGGTSTAPVPPLGGGTPITSPGPFPGTTVNSGYFRHKLSVSADGTLAPGDLFLINSGSHTFVPPPLSGSPNPLNLREEVPVQAFVLLPVAPLSPLTVAVSPSSRGVSLDNQPAGQPIQVTIPTNDRRASFTVRGISRGQFWLVFSGAGCQTGSVYGFVN